MLPDGEIRDAPFGFLATRSVPSDTRAGLRATFADVISDPLPDGLTALVSRLDRSQPGPQTRGQKHAHEDHDDIAFAHQHDGQGGLCTFKPDSRWQDSFLD